LIERSVETPRSPSIAARSLAGPTSGRPCRRADYKEATTRRYPVSEDTSRIMKHTSHEDVFLVVETVNNEAGEIMLVLNVWSAETHKYPA
jgi:hypothetical protein